MKIVEKATQFSSRIAAHCKGRTLTYSDLLSHSASLQASLLRGASDLNSARVAFLMPQSYEYLVSQWAIWRSGGIAVPLCSTHPVPEWLYMIQDSQASLVLVHSSFAKQFSSLQINQPVVQIHDFPPAGSFSSSKELLIDQNRPAQIVYTSGTTGRPKGVVTTHRNIESRLQSMATAWDWSQDDHILEVLPLHHIHGIQNVVGTALYSGARITFHEHFEAARVIKEVINNPTLNVMMAVPTIYSKLIQAFERISFSQQAEFSGRCKGHRLMVSGSMALPEPTLQRWEQISGHVLLERYGMTETGMILTNPLKGKRKPGYVGRPFPSVQVQTHNEQLKVKSPAVFSHYFNREDDTKTSFDEAGYFKTGDVVSQDQEGDFKILGRASVDILKTGGYKVSAIDIESELMKHPQIAEVAVVGLPDYQYGQIVGAVVVAKGGVSLQELQEWCRNRIAAYKKPRKLILLEAMPRNQMGKVNKKELLSLFNKQPLQIR